MGDSGAERFIKMEDSEGSLETAGDAQADLDSMRRRILRLEQSTIHTNAFLANMGQEIRSPINVIRGMAEMLFTTTLNTVQTEYCRTILDTCKMLVTTVDDLLDFSQIDTEKTTLRQDPYDLASFIDDISNLANTRALEKGLDFVTDIAPELPAAFCGDDGRLKQILLNLLNNAVRHTDRGFIRFSAHGDYDEAGRFRLHFCVEDSGIGIKEETLPLLFELFAGPEHQESYSILRSGLGLPISKWLVELMGGAIDVKSTYGQGSSFSFWVLQEPISDQPLAFVESSYQKNVLLLAGGVKGDAYAHMLERLGLPYHHCATAQAFEALEGKECFTHVIYTYDAFHACMQRLVPDFPKGQMLVIKDIRRTGQQPTDPLVNVLFEPLKITDIYRSIHATSDMTPARHRQGISPEYMRYDNVRVLNVDDNEINLLICEEILKQYGIVTDTAENAETAISLAAQRTYDLIFMDHMMPGMDGIELTQYLREHCPKNNRTPVVALTANAIPGMRDVFLSSGMNDYMSKPIEVQELGRVLQTYLTSTSD